MATGRAFVRLLASTMENMKLFYEKTNAGRAPRRGDLSDLPVVDGHCHPLLTDPRALGPTALTDQPQRASSCTAPTSWYCPSPWRWPRLGPGRRWLGRSPGSSSAE